MSRFDVIIITAALSLAACNGEVGALPGGGELSDSGAGARDAGPADAGHPATGGDAGLSAPDAGPTSVDAGSTMSDSGVNPFDAGAGPRPDGGTDAGVQPTDAGTSTVDAGGAPPDAGTRDAGPPPDAGSPVDWRPDAIYLVAQDPSSIDLSTTLPAGVVRGGTFDIDPSGQPLPEGVTLSRAGLLSAADASVGTMTDVVFSYTEP